MLDFAIPDVHRIKLIKKLDKFKPQKKMAIMFGIPCTDPVLDNPYSSLIKSAKIRTNVEYCYDNLAGTVQISPGLIVQKVS